LTLHNCQLSRASIRYAFAICKNRPRGLCSRFNSRTQCLHSPRKQPETPTTVFSVPKCWSLPSDPKHERCNNSPARITTILPQRAELTMGNMPTVRLLSFTPSSQNASMQSLALFACPWAAFDLNLCLLIDYHRIALFTARNTCVNCKKKN